MSTIADKSTKSYHSNCFSSYADDRNKKKLQNVWNVWPEHDDTTKQQFIGKTARQSAINKNQLDEVLLVDGFTIIIFILCILCLFQFLANNMFFQFMFVDQVFIVFGPHFYFYLDCGPIWGGNVCAWFMIGILFFAIFGTSI